jgi:hypothetical protein
VARKREHLDEFERARKFVEDCKQHHDSLMRKVDERSDAYLGIPKQISDSTQWESQLYGKYAMHIIETTLASLVEDKLRYKIRPRMTMADTFDPDANTRLRDGAEAHQILMDWQNRQSKFTRIQRPFLLQNCIAGATALKTTWVERVERRRRMVTDEQPLLGETGEQIIHPQHGPMTYPNLVERVESLPVYDGPMSEVIDLHDLFWSENARTFEESRYVAHRIWMSREDFEREFEDGGMYGESNGGWTLKMVKADLGDAREYADEYGGRWGATKTGTHFKDKLEIIEVWDNFEKQVITFANRRTLVAFKEKFPYYTERHPFTFCTTQAKPFEVVGVSQVEKVQDLQEMLWDIQNQGLDNLKLINNAITIYRPDVEDPDALEFAPRAMWPLEDPAQVQMWSPNPMPAEISLNREGLLKGDMQNLAATFPFSSGTESQTVDQKTATGASIVSGLAQRSIDMAKQPVYDAWEDRGNLVLVYNNQFITEPTAATVLGLDNEEDTKVIWPEVLAGDYHYEQEAIPDAVMQQQEQAKWQGALQVALQAVPVILPLSQAGMAKMLNMDRFVEENLKALGIEDADTFFIAAPAQGAQVPQQGSPPGGGGGAGAGGQPLGITAGEGGGAPGSQIADSPDVALQRALALGSGGGPANA